MLQAGAEIIRKEVAVHQNNNSWISRFLSAPAWQICRLPLYLFDVIKDEWFWRTKMYKFEISYPVDWEKFRAKELAESWRRARKHGVTFRVKTEERR